MARGSDTVDVECVFLHQTDLAIRVEHEEAGAVWLPLDCINEIHGIKQRGQHLTINLDRWMAEQKGLA